MKCFRCQQKGHVASNCPSKHDGNSSLTVSGPGAMGSGKGNQYHKGKGKSDGTPKGFPKGKGKFEHVGKGFMKGKNKGKGKPQPYKGGKKGKLSEMTGSDQTEGWNDGSTDWWWSGQDDGSSWWFDGYINEMSWNWDGWDYPYDHYWEGDQTTQAMQHDSNPGGEHSPTSPTPVVSSVSSPTQKQVTFAPQVSGLMLSALQVDSICGDADRFFFTVDLNGSCECEPNPQFHFQQHFGFPEDTETVSDVFEMFLDCSFSKTAFTTSCTAFDVLDDFEYVFRGTSGQCGFLGAPTTPASFWEYQFRVVSAPTSVEPVVFPLLSQVDGVLAGASWWLLDSGASITVLSEGFQDVFGARVEPWSSSQTFSAANGSPVGMQGEATLDVCFKTLCQGGSDFAWTPARMRGMVGQTRHNIISTTCLCKNGWKITQDEHGFSVVHVDSGLRLTETAIFNGCPWVRIHPQVFHTMSVQPETQLGLTMSLPSHFQDHSVAPLTRKAEQELLQHRLNGHLPFDPRCPVCSNSKSFTQHRRRDSSNMETELQADFAYINSTGEVQSTVFEGGMKILVLTELYTGAIGYVLVQSDLVKTRTSIFRYLKHFGLASSKHSILLHTDAEPAVARLVSNVSDSYVFHIRKAPPQQHQHIGAAERNVRRLKEHLTILRTELQDAQRDLNFNSGEKFQDVLDYIALGHSYFSKTHGSDMSPVEMSCGRRLPAPSSSPFGAIVQAEIPDSLRSHIIGAPRHIDASFLHHGFDGAAVVQGLINIDGNLELKRFHPRNVRQVLPVQYKNELIGDYVVALGVVREPAPPPVERAVIPSTTVPVTGPPTDWIRQHGGTRSCYACKALAETGTRKGKVHGKACIQRYQNWLNRQREIQIMAERDAVARSQVVEASPPVVADAPMQSEASASSRGAAVDVPGGPPGIFDDGPEPSPSLPSRPPSQFSGDIGLKRMRLNSKQSAPEFPPMSISGPSTRNATPPENTMEHQPGDTPSPMEVDRQIEYAERFKRKADQTVEDLEAEMKDGGVESLIWQWPVRCVITGAGLMMPVLGLDRLLATSPELYEPDFCSVMFASKDGGTSKVVTLGGGQVRIWRPDGAVDDSTLQSLDPDKTFQGMIDEIRHLEKCRAGRLNSAKEVELISSRWVTGQKAENVRSRLVAKDVAGGAPSAKALGFASPTPSIEVIHAVLSLAASLDLYVVAIDVSHAFMHSPLGSQIVVLRLPQSVSNVAGEPAFLLLQRALNGLRDASLRWVQMLTEIIATKNLWTDEVEPCVFQGVIKGQPVILMTYVDDLLLVAGSKQVAQEVADAIGKKVPIKVTGELFPSDQGGRSSKFIGRRLVRRPGEKAVFLMVEDSYLDSTFADYQIESGSISVPDLSSHLEKTDDHSKKPLSPESYSRFRKALGRILWLAQSRQDLRVYCSLLGTTGQSRSGC